MFQPMIDFNYIAAHARKWMSLKSTLGISPHDVHTIDYYISEFSVSSE